MPANRPRVRHFAVALALAVTMAGRVQAADPIKLGLILDMSGIYADNTGPGSVLAARMAVEDFGGQVLDRPIEIVVADHQNKPDIAAGVASRWLDVEHVAAIVDISASSPALAVMNVARSRNAIVMTSGAGASSMSNEDCMPTGITWAYNTYALAHATGGAIVKRGGKSWFFITADYTFGTQLEADTASVVNAGGGKVLGDTKVPLGTSDFSAYLLQTQQSGAQVVGFAVAGADMINAVKQASDFNLDRSGQSFAALLAYDNDIHSLGLAATQGLLLNSPFYWDMNDETRAFAHRFYDRLHKMPNMSQAGVHSATLHYLKAVRDVGSLDTRAVLAKMQSTPVNDMFAHGGHLRQDGLMVHDMYLFQVKTPAESKGEWDLYKTIATIKADDAFQPLSQTRCPYLKN
jgi:branched-chain amino acid transport system substrate-binding protein